MKADEIHQQLAAPGHKTRTGLTCECGRTLANERAVNVHQIKPWLSDDAIAAWRGQANW